MHRSDAAGQAPAGKLPAAQSPRSGDWEHRQLDALVESIARQDHGWLRRELRQLEQDLDGQLPKQRGCHFELLAIYADFMELAALLRPHLVREETILFPLVTALAQRRALGGLYDSLAQPMAALLQDHQEITARVGLLEVSTRELRAREDEDQDIRRLTTGLQSLCSTLRQQMGREEEYLFPRVTALEIDRRGAPCLGGGV